MDGADGSQKSGSILYTDVGVAARAATIYDTMSQLATTFTTWAVSSPLALYVE
jgi:hypothetical protein